MQLVIDIPKEAYEQIIEAGDLDYLEVINAIENGTPLDVVLDKIRSEIEEYKSRQLTLAIGVEDLEKGKQIALEYVLAILNKYKAESEG